MAKFSKQVDLQGYLFPVEELPIYVGETKKELKDFKAIVGTIDKNKKKVFSIVSKNYKLITNESAISIGKQLHLQLFPESNADAFEIFNIIAPKTKSFCQIDFIDKNNTLKILKGDTYQPFIRINNSYNRMKALTFDIGFCRSICSNGIIFGDKSIKISSEHNKYTSSTSLINSINKGDFNRLKNEFVATVSKLQGIKIPCKYFMPLAAKVLSIDNRKNLPTVRSKKLQKEKHAYFRERMAQLISRYVILEEMGETAYAFFNVITDYASNSEQLPANTIHGNQRKCGNWLKEFVARVNNDDINWNDEVIGFENWLETNIVG